MCGNLQHICQFASLHQHYDHEMPQEFLSLQIHKQKGSAILDTPDTLQENSMDNTIYIYWK